MIKWHMLTDSRTKYPGTYMDWDPAGGPDGQGARVEKSMDASFLVPDIILDVQKDAIADSTRKAFAMHVQLDEKGDVLPPLNRHRLLIPEPRLDWVEACEIVVAAFTRFDPALGRRAVDVFADKLRINVTQVGVGDASAYVAPSGWQGRSQAEMTFESDGTINDVIYLGHELGHLLADDMARAAGYDPKERETWMPKNTAEIPAYITQMIVYDYLMNGQPDKDLQNAGRQHFVGEVTRSLYELQVGYAHPQGTTLDDAYEARMAAALGPDWKKFEKAAMGRRDSGSLNGHATAAVIAAGLYSSGFKGGGKLFNEIFSRGHNTDVLKIFSAAGITDLPALQKFFTTAAAGLVQPLEAIYTAEYGSKALQSARNLSNLRP